MLRLNQRNLNSGNLHSYQKNLFQEFSSSFNSFLIIILNNLGKEFAFFIPSKFSQTVGWKYTETQLAFYWINDYESITATRSYNSGF